MKKEKVLEIKIIKINDKYSVWSIVYQNEEILKRGEFEDRELKVYSKESLELIGEYLYLRGKVIQHDDIVQVISNEKVEQLKNKVDKINKKYGIQKRWRANNRSEYYFLSSHIEILSNFEYYDKIDNYRYELGNYFKTKEEAEKVLKSEEWKEFWAKVRAGEIGGDKND